MIKVMMLVKRKEGISHEEFVRHYEEVHAPLSLELLPRYRKYVRNHIIGTIEGEEPDFDCITEIWFDNPEAAQAVTKALGGSDVLDGYTTEIGQIFCNDEAKFMDRSKRVSFLVDERASNLP